MVGWMYVCKYALWPGYYTVTTFEHVGHNCGSGQGAREQAWTRAQATHSVCGQVHRHSRDMHAGQTICLGPGEAAHAACSLLAAAEAISNVVQRRVSRACSAQGKAPYTCMHAHRSGDTREACKDGVVLLPTRPTLTVSAILAIAYMLSVLPLCAKPWSTKATCMHQYLCTCVCIFMRFGKRQVKEEKELVQLRSVVRKHVRPHACVQKRVWVPVQQQRGKLCPRRRGVLCAEDVVGANGLWLHANVHERRDSYVLTYTHT
jgi:hypothetical protein